MQDEVGSLRRREDVRDLFQRWRTVLNPEKIPDRSKGDLSLIDAGGAMLPATGAPTARVGALPEPDVSGRQGRGSGAREAEH